MKNTPISYLTSWKVHKCSWDLSKKFAEFLIEIDTDNFYTTKLICKQRNASKGQFVEYRFGIFIKDYFNKWETLQTKSNNFRSNHIPIWQKYCFSEVTTWYLRSWPVWRAGMRGRARRLFSCTTRHSWPPVAYSVNLRKLVIWINLQINGIWIYVVIWYW